jgi:hypothetical protein
VDPVTNPLLFRKSGSTENRTRDLCLCEKIGDRLVTVADEAFRHEDLTGCYRNMYWMEGTDLASSTGSSNLIQRRIIVSPMGLGPSKDAVARPISGCKRQTRPLAKEGGTERMTARIEVQEKICGREPRGVGHQDQLNDGKPLVVK